VEADLSLKNKFPEKFLWKTSQKKSGRKRHLMWKRNGLRSPPPPKLNKQTFSHLILGGQKEREKALDREAEWVEAEAPRRERVGISADALVIDMSYDSQV